MNAPRNEKSDPIIPKNYSPFCNSPKHGNSIKHSKSPTLTDIPFPIPFPVQASLILSKL
jgi:hypothetical protein